MQQQLMFIVLKITNFVELSSQVFCSCLLSYCLKILYKQLDYSYFQFTYKTGHTRQYAPFLEAPRPTPSISYNTYEMPLCNCDTIRKYLRALRYIII